MRKLLITLLILSLALPAFAMTQIRRYTVTPDVFLKDNAAWTGSKTFNGRPVILSGSTIALNRNYITSINVYGWDALDSTSIITVRYKLNGFTCDGKPANLTLACQGYVGWKGYDSYSTQKKSWKPTTVSNMPGPAKFENNGILLNPAYTPVSLTIGLNENPFAHLASWKNVNGTNYLYPEWAVYFDQKMPKSIYESLFKSALQGSSYVVIEHPTPVNDGTR